MVKILSKYGIILRIYIMGINNCERIYTHNTIHSFKSIIIVLIVVQNPTPIYGRFSQIFHDRRKIVVNHVLALYPL